ncbi:6-pyruvoyl-tetrahydropterin synthase-related protein [Streptococcus suis]|uniref:6-pyruvoyl-tetrahydropterin synthase-related protein n=1 Tax=Streptococcus suis TaxID=1307 RepID=UPI000CF69078|nr:6-pyruvoyl-tetrahydropterin synthase-related protein [Streptococcus suis]
MKSLLKNIAVLLLFLLLTAIYFYSFFGTRGLMTGHDLFFHAARAQSMTNIWSSPVNFKSFIGGIPIAQFYPGLTFFPMSILLLFQGIIGFLNTFKIYLFVLTLLTLYSCYFVGKRLKNEMTGFIFAFLYTFSTYRTINILVRMGIGELIAMSILPLVIYGFYELFYGDKKKWYILAISVSLLSYTHLLITFATLIFLTIFFVIYVCQARLEDIRERFGALLYAVGVSFLLSSAFIIPFIEQLLFQEIYTTYAWLPQGEQITTLLGGILLNRLEIFTPGIIVFLLLIYLAVCYRGLSRWQKYLFITGLVCFFMTTNLFPWEFFNKTPLKNFQFAWRFNTFVTLFLTFSFALYISGTKWAKISLCFLLPLTFVFHIHGWNYFRNNLPSHYPVWEMQSDSELPVVNGSAFYYDYTNIHVSQESQDIVREHRYFLNGEQVQVGEEITQDQVHIWLLNHQEGAILQLPLFRYKGQVVLVNGQEIEATVSEKGLTQVRIPAGNLDILVKYRYTFSAISSAIVSLFATLILILHILKSSKKDDSFNRRRRYRKRVKTM